MSDWGYFNAPQITEAAGSDTSTSSGTAPSTPGSTHTMGAWTQLIASTARQGCGLLINIFADGATITGLMDIGIGGSGAEQILIPKLHFQRLASSYGGTGVFFIPCAIPSGSRLSCRYQGSITSATVRVSAQVVASSAGTPIFGRNVAAYGVSTAASKGTQVTASASTNTKGAWTEITAATTQTSNWAVLSIINDGTVGKLNLIDIGIGTSGSEQIIIPNLYLPASQTSQLTAGGKVSMPLLIPSGVRIAARAQSDVASAQFSVSIHAVG